MLVVVGDPFYSSLAHLIRVLRVFELCKQLGTGEVETQLFVYEGGAGHQVERLISDAIAGGIVDKVIPVPTQAGRYFDLNRAKTLASYIGQNKRLLLDELRHKGRHLNHLAASSQQVVVFSSPGFLGGWYVPPFVPPNVRMILILDTPFHPESEIHFGTAWDTRSFKGRLQSLLLQFRLFRPFLKIVNQMREELGLSVVKTRQSLYSGLPVLDPNVPSYMKLKREVKDYYSIGPLVLSQGKPEAGQVKMLQDFKGDNRLVYITLGGSVKTPRFASFIRHLVETISRKTGDKVRFLITTGSIVDPKVVCDALGDYVSRCWVHGFYDANLVTSVADVAVGVMGQGHVLLAAQNGCPVVMCPINADQATHANLVRRLGLGESPLHIQPHELFQSEVLIEKVLGNAKIFALSSVKVLENSARYKNKRIQAELSDCDQEYQKEIVGRLISRS